MGAFEIYFFLSTFHLIKHGFLILQASLVRRACKNAPHLREREGRRMRATSAATGNPSSSLSSIVTSHLARSFATGDLASPGDLSRHLEGNSQLSHLPLLPPPPPIPPFLQDSGVDLSALCHQSENCSSALKSLEQVRLLRPCA